jgi:hypothetical protein
MGGDGAASGVPTARPSGHKSDNARREPLEEQRATKTEDGFHPLHRRLPALPPSGPRSLRTLLVKHPGELRVNPDASRFCAAFEIAGIVGRAPSALGGCSGTAGRPHAASPVERTKRTPRRSRFGHGRSACRYAPACRNARRGRGELYRPSSVGNRPPSHRQTSRWGAILRLDLCLSGWGHDIRIALAGLPGVVPGFSSAYSPTTFRHKRGTPAGKYVAPRGRVDGEETAQSLEQNARRWKAWMSSMSAAYVKTRAHPPFPPLCCCD